MWEGGTVFIIGGGPSTPRQFSVPEDIISQVTQGGASPVLYSPYMEALHTKHVIGINIAYMLGGWLDMVFWGDKKFFLKHQYGLAKFPNLRVTCSPTPYSPGWVKVVGKDKSKMYGISNNPKMVSWNANSGAAAISLAASAGASRIVLLGFDMSLDASGYQHWHGEYRRYPRDVQHEKSNLPFVRHLQGFPAIAKDAKARGIEILNASPTSAIKEFPKIYISDVL